MSSLDPYGAQYPRWYRRAKDWKSLLLVLLIVGAVGAGSFFVGYLPDQVSHRRKPDLAAFAVAARFAQAVFVTRDCAAAQALEDDRDLIVYCGHGRIGSDALYQRIISGDRTTDFSLVRGAGAIVPHCKFTGVYGRYGRKAAGRDPNGDACVTFRLVARVAGKVESGYLALYPVYSEHRWQVESNMWWVGDNGRCVSGCAALWSHRIKRHEIPRVLTRLDASALRAAKAFVKQIFVRFDCDAAMKLVSPALATELADSGCLDFDVIDPTELYVIRGSGQVDPGCSPRYPAMSRNANDDSCVVYELIGPGDPLSDAPYEVGYLALYLHSSADGWKVIGYTANSNPDVCDSGCLSLWRRRERKLGLYSDVIQGSSQ